VTRGRAVLAGAALALLFGVTSAASAASAASPVGDPTPPTPPVTAAEDAPVVTTSLDLQAGSSADLGASVTLRARLTAADGTPVTDAVVVIVSEAAWGEVEGEVELGRDRTDRNGIATAAAAMRRTGAIEVVARFAGDDRRQAATSPPVSIRVTGDAQLYTPKVGVRIPGLGGWLIAVVVAAVWLLYLSVAGRLALIARAGAPVAPTAVGTAARRHFLTRFAVPAALGGFVAGMAGALPTVIIRSPRTHGSLRTYLTHSRFQRSPFAPIGRRAEMRPMPEALDRLVTFEADVRPILLRRGGPHAIPPKNSPPPAGVRFDTYEAIMAREGLVVPGNPEESEIVEVLLNPAMNMPPSMPPLPDDEVQLIVTWIAQGAPKA